MDALLTPESLPQLIRTFVWYLLAFSVLSYFIGSYLFEILAQKQDEPRWMAWVPIANGYLALRLIGLGGVFWLLCAGIAFALLGAILPGPLSVLSALVLVPTVLAALLLGLVYWPMLARRRDLPLWIGLVVMLPNFTPLLDFALSDRASLALGLAAGAAALAAFLWIVFHDGGPHQAPHPVGYVLTGVGTLVGVALALQLPVWLEQSGGIEKLQVALASAREAADDTEGGDDFAALLASFDGADADEGPIDDAAPAFPPAAIPSDPDPYVVADTCPSGAREGGARPPRGLEWWCEIEGNAGWVRHGPARRWLHARAVAEEGEYADGERHGTWTRYWRTGGRHTQAEFRNGEQHGWMHRWDEAGRLESRTWYREGEPAPLETPGV